MSSRRHSFRLVAALICLLALLAPISAHNVAVTHPLITDVAFDTFRQADISATGGMGALGDDCETCAYNELWEHRGMLDPPTTAANYEMSDQYIDAFNDDDEASLMIGVVIEDGNSFASEGRVVNHFYHAITGVGLLDDFNSSQVRAQELFLFGMQLHDYTDSSQERSYIYAGRFLHHVEDMSSPAHVHNDAHLYAFGQNNDKDDYEGRWVPTVVWGSTATPLGIDLRNALTSGAPPTPISSASDIWSAPTLTNPVPLATIADDNSLSGFVYNRSTYWASIPYPNDGVAPPATGVMGGPSGELPEMFPGDPADPADNGLNWVSPMFGFDRWVIDGVGEYHYRASWGSEDDWFPDTAANERSTGDPDLMMAQYYIEQLMSGDAANTALEPERIRQDWSQVWNATTNPVVQNTFCVGGPTPGAACSRNATCAPGVCDGDSITELQTANLLVPAVTHVAGAAQWWFRYTNLPPYLKKVDVTQGAGAAKYAAEWTETAEMETRELVEAGIIGNTDEEIEVINERIFQHNPSERRYINALAADDLVLVLEFNEPIRDISELKLLDSGGGEVLDLLALVTMQGGMPVKSMPDHDIWTYTIQSAGLAGLNGELTLKVMAQDRNEHEQDGGELDATPNSPAKRNFTGPIDLRNPDIPWHTEMTEPMFVYDFTTGDLNHRLLFDSEKPTTTIGVTP